MAHQEENKVQESFGIPEYFEISKEIEQGMKYEDLVHPIKVKCCQSHLSQFNQIISDLSSPWSFRLWKIFHYEKALSEVQL